MDNKTCSRSSFNNWFFFHILGDTSELSDLFPTAEEEIHEAKDVLNFDIADTEMPEEKDVNVEKTEPIKSTFSLVSYASSECDD